MADKGLYYISSREYIKGVGWSTWSKMPYNGEFYPDIVEADKAIGEMECPEGIELRAARVENYPFNNFG